MGKKLKGFKMAQTKANAKSAVLGNMTKVEVGAGSGASTFQPICVFGGEAVVDFGTYSTNKEYCLSKNEAYVALNELEFASQSYTYLWSEGLGDLANKIIREAHLATTLADKTITLVVEANNGTSGKGATYTADFLVTGYKFLFKKGEVNKIEFSIEQLTAPTEVVATT